MTNRPQTAQETRVSCGPYSENPAWVEVLRGGDRIRIRQIHADDKPMVRRFIEDLSPDSRRFRFRDSMLSPNDALLRLLTEIDPATDLAYVAVIDDRAANTEVGVARFSTGTDGSNAEFAIVVADKWQRKGLGTHLMRHLINAARARGILRIHSSDPADDHLMRSFAAHLHLRHQPDPSDPGQTLYLTELGAPVAVSGSDDGRAPIRAAFQQKGLSHEPPTR